MSKPHRFLLAPVLIAALLPAADAGAFSVRLGSSGDVAHWESPVLEYYIQQAGSDDLEPAEALAAVLRGFQSWRTLECSAIDFVEKGDVPNPKTVALVTYDANGKNELAWIEDSDWTLGQYVLGVTLPLTTAEGVIYEADIAFNGYQIKWRTTDSGPGTDLESVAVHEIGHMFGLQHNLGPYSWQQPPTMAPNVASKNKSRTLEDDDIMAACYLYPHEPPYGCEDDDQCPLVVARDASDDEYYSGRFRCVDGACSELEIFPNAVSNIGESCQTQGSCVDGLHCQPYADSALCTEYCAVADPECPEEFSCAPFQRYPEYGVCIPDSGEIFEPGQGPAGCVSAASCGTGLVCVPTPTGEKKACTTTCLVSEPATCPPDKQCWSYGEGNDNGACFAPDEWPVEPEPELEPEPQPEVGPEPGPEPEVEVAGDADAGSDAGVDTGETTGGDKADDGCAGAGGAGGLAWAALALLGLAIVRRRRLV